MALERGRGARRFRTYLRKRRCYEKITEEYDDLRYWQRLADRRLIWRFYLVNEGRKHIYSYYYGDRYCYFAGIRSKYESQMESLDNEVSEYGIFAPKSKPNRVWTFWKGR